MSDPSDAEIRNGITAKMRELRAEVRQARKAARGIPKPEDTDLTLTDLQAIERKSPRRSDRPRTLPMADIKLAVQVFQHRIANSDPLASEQHIRRLTDDINNRIKGVGTPMTALIVTAVGNEFYLVEGHHRYEAYLRSKWQRQIPVTYFEGKVVAARAKSLSLNLTGKLPLNNASRSEAAWQLVKEDNHNKGDIAELAGRSTSLVGYMRRRLASNEKLRELPWASAVGAKDNDEVFTRDERDAAAAVKAAKDIDRIVARMCKNMGPKFPYSPYIMAKVLAQIDEDLPGKLIVQWLHIARGIVEHNTLDI